MRIFFIILTAAGLAQSLERLTVEREEVWIPGSEPLLRVIRWLDTVFQCQYPPSLNIPCKLRHHKQRFGKIATTVVLDKAENFL